MGDIALPRRLFLWSMALIYMSAFVSLYMQIPGKGLVSCTFQLKWCVSLLACEFCATPIRAPRYRRCPDLSVWNFLQTVLCGQRQQKPPAA